MTANEQADLWVAFLLAVMVSLLFASVAALAIGVRNQRRARAWDQHVDGVLVLLDEDVAVDRAADDFSVWEREVSDDA